MSVIHGIAINDGKKNGEIDLTELWAKESSKIADRFLEERRRTSMMREIEERVYKRVMKDIDIQIIDKATPALKDLEKQLMNLGRRK